MRSRDELHNVAVEVIRHLKLISDYANEKVSVIGGLALWMYVATGRTTQDVDFIISLDSAPKTVKSKLLKLPNSPFFERTQLFFYRTGAGEYDRVQIDITPGWQSPYIPDSAMRLKDIPLGTVPYISRVDLIIFKINSCGMRESAQKKFTDAQDAEALLLQEIVNGPLSLTSDQQKIVEVGLPAVLERSGMTGEWWRESLGLPPNYWTWSDEYQSWYHINDDGSYEWSTQENSSTGPSQSGGKHKGHGKGKGKGKGKSKR